MSFASLLIFLVICIIGLLAARIDQKSFLLPNRHTGSIFTIGLVSHSINVRGDTFYLAVSISLLHLILALISPNSFGMGDVKFISGLAFSFTYTHFIWLWLSLTYIFGLIHGFYLRFWRNKPRIPFGPSIYGAWVVVYMGELTHVAMDYSR